MKSVACGLVAGGWFWALRAIETGSQGIAILSAVAIGIAALVFTLDDHV